MPSPYEGLFLIMNLLYDPPGALLRGITKGELMLTYRLVSD